MDFLLRYEVWLIAAVILIAVDVVIGLDFILLAFGVGAATTGGSLLWDDNLNMPYVGDWESLVTFFGIFSLAILIPMRMVIKRLQRKADAVDINKY